MRPRELRTPEGAYRLRDENTIMIAFFRFTVKGKHEIRGVFSVPGFAHTNEGGDENERHL